MRKRGRQQQDRLNQRFPFARSGIYRYLYHKFLNSTESWRNYALQAKVDALERAQGETAAELDALLPSILDRAFKGEP